MPKPAEAAVASLPGRAEVAAEAAALVALETTPPAAEVAVPAAEVTVPAAELAPPLAEEATTIAPAEADE